MLIAQLGCSLQDFYKYAALLIVFAKRIRECKLIGNSQIKQLSWSPKTVLGVDGIEIGEVCLFRQKQWIETKIIHFHLSSGNIIFPLSNDLQKNNTLTEVPTFWVTAPTTETLRIRFVINAKFDITTGRTSLDRNSANNHRLMGEIGKELAEKLIQLFQLSKSDWPKLRQTLGINDDLGVYEFWQFIWQVIVTDWLDYSHTDLRDLIKVGLGGQSNGFGSLAINCAAIPNELHGAVKQLVRLRDLRYYLKGLLTEADILNTVLQWSHFQKKYSSSCLINDQIWQQVKKLLPEQDHKIEPLQLVDIVKEVLAPNFLVDPDTAYRLGEIINSEQMKDWKISPKHKNEYDELHKILIEQAVYFKNYDDQFVAARQLLIKEHHDSNEERKIADFAPNNSILNKDYYPQAIKFFLVCREVRETIEIENLCNWARHANTEEQKKAVTEYLLSGERRDVFADCLKNYISGSWMQDDSRINHLIKLYAQIKQPILAEENYELNSNNLYPSPELDFSLSIDIQEIYNWWNGNYSDQITNYNISLYPMGIDQMKSGLLNGDRATWLILFFLGATHTLGRTRNEQHRDFIKYCIDSGWWEIFSFPDPQDDPEIWMGVLDKYHDLLIDNTMWYI